jgi:hypothetical protein
MILNLTVQSIRETKSHPRPLCGLAGGPEQASEHHHVRAALLTCMLHIVSASAETGSAPVSLAAIKWVSMLPIRETKSHPRKICALAGASILSSLLTLSPPYMHVV